MNYIQIEKDGERTISIKCVHPKVEKFWQHGGGAIGGTQYHNVEMNLIDGTRKTFSNNGNESIDPLELAEQFLQTLH